MYYLSIDPSIANTGLCLWRDGDVIKHHTIKAPTVLIKRDLSVRLGYLLDGVRTFIGGRTIKTTAIEEFQGHVKHNTLALMKCSAAQGALIAIAAEFSENIVMINKRNESKEVAYAAALSFGLKDFDEHTADAFRIGQLAGFDRHEKER